MLASAIASTLEGPPRGTTLSAVGATSLEDDDWTAADAAEALLAYATSIAENGPTTVAKHEYQAARKRVFADPKTRRVADKKLLARRRCSSVELVNIML